MINKNNLQQSDYYKTLIAEYAVECSWVYSLTLHRFQYISPSVYSLLGFTVEEALNHSLERILTPESLQRIKNSGFKRYQRFLSGDRSEEILSDISELEQYCKNGSTKIIETSTKIYYNETADSIEIIGVSRDITKRIQYEKNLICKLRSYQGLNNHEERKNSDAVNKIRIYFFYQFKVYGAGQTVPICWHTQKNEELFAFLLSQKDIPINKDDILENLWSDIDVKKASTYLHNTLYSMKQDLKNAGIDCHTRIRNNHYYLTLPDFYSDIKFFSSLIENTVFPFQGIDPNSAETLEQLMLVYRGDFLSKNGYSWSLPLSARLHNDFKTMAKALAGYYFFKHNYDATKRILLKMLDIDNYDEAIHELILNVYLQEKNYNSFLSHYTELETFLQIECHVKPRSSIQALYQEAYPHIIHSIKFQSSSF